MTSIVDAQRFALQYLYEHYLLSDLKKNEPITQFSMNRTLNFNFCTSVERMIKQLGSVTDREVVLLLESFILSHTLSGSIQLLDHKPRELPKLNNREARNEV